MKVLYVLHSRTGSPGGHVFSLQHISSALSDKIDVGVIVLGLAPKILKGLTFYKGEFSYDKNNKDLGVFLRNEKPDIIHCFDIDSYFYFIAHCYNLYNRIILTKCGGPSPRLGFKFPYCKDVILFSKENYSFFTKSLLFRSANFYLLPNRVKTDLINIIDKKNTNVFTFVQIIRFSNTKEREIFSTLYLINRLINDGENVRLLLAGTVNDVCIYKKVLAYIRDKKLSNHIEIINDSRVNNGSDLLSQGDCVIATGRSIMEALALSKLVLTPAKNLSIPEVLDLDNFDNLFYSNFSGRAILNTTDEKVYHRIRKLIDHPQYMMELKEKQRQLSKLNFEITDNVVNKYYSIYANLEKSKKKIVLFRNLIPLFFYCKNKI